MSSSVLDVDLIGVEDNIKFNFLRPPTMNTSFNLVQYFFCIPSIFLIQIGSSGRDLRYIFVGVTERSSQIINLACIYKQMINL